MRRRHQMELIQTLRRYFQQEGFLEALTPPLVENPGMETHIHPFQVYSAHRKTLEPLYLHTSPEFCLKELLSDAKEEGWDKLYSLDYCFRDEPSSPIHRPQFLMLEWYRLNARYEQIMDDVEGLIRFCLRECRAPARAGLRGAPVTRMTMRELWLTTVGIDPLDYLDAASLRGLISTRFTDVPLPESELPWDDLFFLLFLNKVEPEMKRWPILMVTEFPAPLSALSTLKESDPRVCERFEVYVTGIELCNAYNELTDLREQRRRFDEQATQKERLYGYRLPSPSRFLAALDKGLPPSAGIALGVERLLHSLFDVENPFFY